MNQAYKKKDDSETYQGKKAPGVNDVIDALNKNGEVQEIVQTSPICQFHRTMGKDRSESMQPRSSCPPRLIQKFYEVMNRIDHEHIYERVFQGGAAQVRDLFWPKKDIDFEIIQAKAEGEIPFTDKGPWLYALKTEEHIQSHFIPFPTIRRQVDELISQDRDLLLFGPPFLGKTSFLTYLSLEASRQYKGTVVIVRLNIPKDLKPEEAQGAGARLVQKLSCLGLLDEKKRTIFVIDDVHEPGVMAITRELLSSPRHYRIWGAAGFAFLAMEKGNPWLREDIIKKACNFVAEEDIDYFSEHILQPLLTAKGEEGQRARIDATMKSLVPVPVRFLCQVWKLIKDTRADENIRYAQLIAREPTRGNEIVKSVLPHTIPGIKALVIADFLKGPPWELLTYVLSKIEDFGLDLADNTLNSLSHLFLRLPDQEEPDRVFLYEPARVGIRKPGNLTVRFKAEIWQAVHNFLEERKAKEDKSLHQTRYGFWLSLAELAKREDQRELAVCCAQRALEYCFCLEQEVKALFEIAMTTSYLKGTWSEDVIRMLCRVIEKSAELEQITLDAAFAKAILGSLLLHRNPPDGEKALPFLQEATNACVLLGSKPELGYLSKTTALIEIEQGGKEREKAVGHAKQARKTYQALKNTGSEIDSLYMLTFCLRMQSVPEWAQAVHYVKDALTLQNTPEMKVERAKTLYQLAFCLSNKPDPDWLEGVRASRESLEILMGLGHKNETKDYLLQLAWLCHKQQEPNWKEAITNYKAALEILTEPHQYADRAVVHYLLGYCFTHQTESDWPEAITNFRKALKIQQGEEHKEDRGFTLFSLALCLYNQPEPDW
ncbi:MAG: hypothetical protein JXA79_07320, partial [Deltaproteobacteria bacterium]|nr:hypothetical protein [Deltaproteobacteria bacterium]